MSQILHQIVIYALRQSSSLFDLSLVLAEHLADKCARLPANGVPAQHAPSSKIVEVSVPLHLFERGEMRLGQCRASSKVGAICLWRDRGKVRRMVALARRKIGTVGPRRPLPRLPRPWPYRGFRHGSARGAGHRRRQ